MITTVVISLVVGVSVGILIGRYGPGVVEIIKLLFL